MHSTGGHKWDDNVALCLLNVEICSCFLTCDAVVALYLLAGFVVCLPPGGQTLINAALNKTRLAFLLAFANWFTN